MERHLISNTNYTTEWGFISGFHTLSDITYSVVYNAVPEIRLAGSVSMEWFLAINFQFTVHTRSNGCHGNIAYITNYIIGFNHGLPCYVKNMARGTQVDKNRGRRPRFLSWLRPEGHVFNIAWQAMIKTYYNMTLWILAGNYISFTIAAGLIRLHMPGVKKSRV